MAATVLVAGDERKLRELVRSCLERDGFTVLSGGSGAEAPTLPASVAPTRSSSISACRMCLARGAQMTRVGGWRTRSA